MSVRGKQPARQNNKTQLQLAREERQHRESADQARNDDIAAVREAANKGWVEIKPDGRKGPGFHRYRCGYLRRALKGGDTWYVFECANDADAPMTVISVAAWGRWWLGQVAGKPMLELAKPKPTGDEKRDSIAYTLWHRKCKAVIEAARETGERWWWNGGRDDNPWHKCGVLRITKVMRQAA